MSIRIEAIKSPTQIINTSRVKSAADAAVKAFVADVQNQMQRYPPQQATSSGYIRKGSAGYGGAWRIVPITDGWAVLNDVVSTESRYRRRRRDGTVYIVTYRHAPKRYAGYVGGFRTGPNAAQAREMARRGWPSIQDVAEKTLPKHKPAMLKALRSKP